jgi:hypothetical protein
MSECCAMCSMFSCDCGPEAECQKDAYRWESYRGLKSQLAAAQAEVTRLSGKTGFCTQCEAYAKERDRYKAALAKIADMPCPPDADMDMKEIAKSALEGEKK